MNPIIDFDQLFQLGREFGFPVVVIILLALGVLQTGKSAKRDDDNHAVIVEILKERILEERSAKEQERQDRLESDERLKQSLDVYRQLSTTVTELQKEVLRNAGRKRTQSDD